VNGAAGAMKRRFDRDERGATAIEFAFVAPVLCLLILGFLDFGHQAYVRSIAVGAIEQVGRSAGVGGAAVDPTTFEAQVETMVRRVAKSATFAWDKKSYYQFSGIGKPEKLIDDKNGNGQYDPGDCWEDLNPNGVYDTSPGRSGVGGADDIVYYQLTVTFPPLISLGGFNSLLAGNHRTTVGTIVRRQPFAAQAVPVIRC
jgi:Flp pilus assembly pilin Flp